MGDVHENHKVKKDCATLPPVGDNGDNGSDGEYEVVTHPKKRRNRRSGGGGAHNADGSGKDYNHDNANTSDSGSIEADVMTRTAATGAAGRGKLPPHENRLRTKPCKWLFADGGCHRGDACWFSHDINLYMADPTYASWEVVRCAWEAEQKASKLVSPAALAATQTSDNNTGKQNAGTPATAPAPPPAPPPMTMSYSAVVAANAPPTAATAPPPPVDTSAAHPDVATTDPSSDASSDLVHVDTYDALYNALFDRVFDYPHDADEDCVVFCVSPTCRMYLSVVSKNAAVANLIDWSMHTSNFVLVLHDYVIDTDDEMMRAEDEGMLWRTVDAICNYLHCTLFYSTNNDMGAAWALVCDYDFLFTYPSAPDTVVTTHYFNWRMSMHAMWRVTAMEIDTLQKNLELAQLHLRAGQLQQDLHNHPRAAARMAPAMPMKMKIGNILNAV